MTDTGKPNIDKPKFVYVTYVRTTAEKLWRALIEPEFTRRYWCETVQESDWKVGSPWRIMIPDGYVTYIAATREGAGDRATQYFFGFAVEVEPRAGGTSSCCGPMEMRGDGLWSPPLTYQPGWFRA